MILLNCFRDVILFWRDSMAGEKGVLSPYAAV